MEHNTMNMKCMMSDSMEFMNRIGFARFYPNVSKLFAQGISRRLGMLGLTLILSKVVVKRIKMLSNRQNEKWNKFGDVSAEPERQLNETKAEKY
jgi:hypothetical protein